ncbi:MAG TPA: class I SAM-dependent methyltransferase [Stellaceae bacterium]|nr:class I SAM-dependent methyltransferase [Stellaceae bacterium]
MADNPLLRARTAALDSDSPQERNRRWWEQLPMTYERWEHADRATTRARAIDMFLSSNPWLGRDRFARFTGKRVLEIGCGAGPAACLFAEDGALVTAIDLTETAVDLTRRHTTGLDVTVERMDAERMSFADASFDHVFSWGVLHHSAEPARTFAEVARVLRPGGTALIMVYNRASARYWIKGAITLLLRGRLFRGDSFASVQRFFTDGYFHHHFTPREFARALAPMRVERISLTHMSGRMLPLLPRAIDEWCKRRWGWLLIAEARR